MVFFASLPVDAGPRNVFVSYPDIYGPWSEMSEALMNGPSPLSQGERELILAYAAGVAGCAFVCVAHSEVAYAWGVEEGLVGRLLDDLDSAPAQPNLKALLAFVRKLSLTPTAISQEDADMVFRAGWDEQALHDAIALTARAAFMQRIVEGHGFKPLSRDQAAHHAKRRKDLGYVNLYPQFRGAR